MFLSLIDDCDRLTNSVYQLGKEVKEYIQRAGDRYFGGNHGLIKVLIEHTGKTVLIEGDIYDTQKLMALLSETDSEVIDNIDPYDLWDYIADCLVSEIEEVEEIEEDWAIEDDDWAIEGIDKKVEDINQPLTLGFIQKQEIALLDSLIEGIDNLQKVSTTTIDSSLVNTIKELTQRVSVLEKRMATLQADFINFS